MCVCVCVCIYRPHSCGRAYACRIWLLRSLLLAVGVPAPVASGLMAPGPQSGTGRVAMKATGQLANYVHDGPPEGGPVVVLWFIFHIYISNYKRKETRCGLAVASRKHYRGMKGPVGVRFHRPRASVGL